LKFTFLSKKASFYQSCLTSHSIGTPW